MELGTLPLLEQQKLLKELTSVTDVLLRDKNSVSLVFIPLTESKSDFEKDSYVFLSLKRCSMRERLGTEILQKAQDAAIRSNSKNTKPSIPKFFTPSNLLNNSTKTAQDLIYSRKTKNFLKTVSASVTLLGGVILSGFLVLLLSDDSSIENTIRAKESVPLVASTRQTQTDTTKINTLILSEEKKESKKSPVIQKSNANKNAKASVKNTIQQPSVAKAKLDLSVGQLPSVEQKTELTIKLDQKPNEIQFDTDNFPIEFSDSKSQNANKQISVKNNSPAVKSFRERIKKNDEEKYDGYFSKITMSDEMGYPVRNGKGEEIFVRSRSFVF